MKDNHEDQKDQSTKKRSEVLKPEYVEKEVLETIPYIYAGRRTDVEIIFPEFTSVCPWTGLPDFGELRINYVPREHCVELKSLKFYLNSFRNVGIIQEDVVNHILDDLVALLAPISMTVTGNFNPRGGIRTLASVSYPQ